MANLGSKLTKTALERITKRRKEMGLSQATLASLAKVNASYIGLIERGQREPSLNVLAAMGEAVDLTPAELFAGTNPKASKEIPEMAQVRSLFRTWPSEHRQAAVRAIKEMAKLRQNQT